MTIFILLTPATAINRGRDATNACHMLFCHFTLYHAADELPPPSFDAFAAAWLLYFYRLYRLFIPPMLTLSPITKRATAAVFRHAYFR